MRSHAAIAGIGLSVLAHVLGGATPEGRPLGRVGGSPITDMDVTVAPASFSLRFAARTGREPDQAEKAELDRLVAPTERARFTTAAVSAVVGLVLRETLERQGIRVPCRSQAGCGTRRRTARCRRESS